MIISKGHTQFVKFIHLMQVVDRDNVIRLLDDEYPDGSGPTIMALIGREDHLQVQLWYTVEGCKIVWNKDDVDCTCCEQPLDDIPMVVGYVVSYLEGLTSELTFPVKE